MFDRIGFSRIGILTLATLLGAGLALTPGAAGQTTWYVDDDAPNDPGPGDPGISDPDEDGSAEHPFDAIQEGIDAGSNDDTVLVADGTYAGTGNKDLDFGGKPIAVRSENGPDTCIIDCEGREADPHRGFYFHSAEDAASVVHGFTITNGYASGNWPSSAGGAVCCTESSPTIMNCRIIGNTAENGWGGGICCAGTTVVVNCDFVGNAADFGSGACGWESATFTNCTFSENTGYSGGGAYFVGDASVSDCTFTGNTAAGGGGAMCSGNVVIADCIFSANSAGGLSCAGEAMIINCVVTDNFGGDYGGGIFCYDEATIANCVIAGNAAAYGGGGVCCWQGSPVIRNCVIANNRWVDCGGAVACLAGSPTFENCLMSGNMVIWIGGGLYCVGGASVTLINCAITDNTRPGHSGGGGLDCGNCSLIVRNCILWANAGTGGPEIRLYGSTLTVSYSDVEGGEAAAEVDDGSTLAWGAGNIDVDPLFVDPDGPDDDPNTWGDNNHRVSGNSPCIDAGDNEAVPIWLTTDLDGRLRCADRIGTVDTGNPGAPGPPIVDMGSYEYQCAGDLDGNGEIGLADLAALLAHYGSTTGAAYTHGDLDQDGDVDLGDLAGLLVAYGTTCE